ncbi:cation-translocating P-type ATPase [Gloeothece verrucosa]|uniref:ATPase, P-type (Transporting), HAD superfamily, subfamily IC n=1 Tax=Gloeothece verrucosa (strain PCC 7822) TaxID=497965 RepID=E0U9S1_GLOV7|nr:cation-transporting P-type ATPase [Gloeothece verrucosa]ADN14991.1 ATPase, P-type (transporting), HAD superfamily, subfamily IC [Gloeothece verrucosa PCC 7822]
MKIIPKQHWHHLPISELLNLLETDSQQGLHPLEVENRQQRYGPNALTQKEGKSPVVIFLEQFNQPLIYILMAAGVITGLLREWVDMGVIFAVVLLNAIVGFVQEAKAVEAMEALAKTMQSEATVVRGGEKQRISADELVPGDLVFLQSGDKVPADLRLIQTRDLQIDESALTGESLPVEKESIDQLSSDIVLADRNNMAHSSTLVTYGTGTGVVVATGDKTEIGQINEMIASAEVLETPLTAQIEQFSLTLMKVILSIAALTFFAGLLRSQVVDRETLKEAFLEVVALAVGAVPEGLPVVVTITLAIGVSRMAKRQAIIRKLPAVETLGSTTVICSDKTGTLTQNAMTVQDIFAGDQDYQVSGIGYGLEGELTQQGIKADFNANYALKECLIAGLLCNDTRLVFKEQKWRVEGDPTEAALITSATKAGLSKETLEQELPRVDTLPFESQHQYMATLHQLAPDQPPIAYIKGSVEKILTRCHDGYSTQGEKIPLNADLIHAKVDEMAHQGLRVLAFARAEFPLDTFSITHESIESRLTFLGLQAMIDPARPEAIEAVKNCQRAGIQVKMITGDHIGTATAIGRKLGLNNSMGEVLTISGKEISEFTDEELIGVVDRVSVFARVAPEQKLRLVKALQARKNVVAMTGDGVNDAPALRQADIGTAMGITGTEVAKEAADMVLLDDNFATIRAAVEEGRRIYDNIIKSIIWLLPTNASLGLIIVVSSFFNLGMPVTPLHILWINTVAAVLLGTTLAFEVAEPGIMERPPRPPQMPLLQRSTVSRIILVGCILCVMAFAVYFLEKTNTATSQASAQTAAANAIVFGQIFLLFNCRSRRYTMFRVGAFSNRWLIAGVISMIIAQLLFTYTPIMNEIFTTAPIGVTEWALILGSSVGLYIFIELIKRGLRKQEKAKRANS